MIKVFCDALMTRSYRSVKTNRIEARETGRTALELSSRILQMIRTRPTSDYVIRLDSLETAGGVVLAGDQINLRVFTTGAHSFAPFKVGCPKKAIAVITAMPVRIPPLYQED